MVFPRRADYEAALAERDARIAELEGEIAEAARIAEGAEALRKEMDELRRRGDEERVGFELQLAGVRNVKAARALLADHDNGAEKLKAAEPWLFSASCVWSSPSFGNDHGEFSGLGTQLFRVRSRARR